VSYTPFNRAAEEAERWQQRHSANLAERLREMRTADAEAASRQLRRVRMSGMTRKIAEAIAIAPDAYPDVSPERLARLVVDEIERVEG
jgi:hypothetical protein